jgi:hypothetical protein
MDKAVTPLTDLITLDAHNKKEMKAKRVLLESVKDHIIPHLTQKRLTKDMFDTLVILFQRNNMNMKMILRNKLRLVQMSISDNVTSYLMRITQVCEKITAIWETTEDVDLMNFSLNGLPKSREPFVKGFCAWDNLLDWKRLWDDFIQEETLEEPKDNNKGVSEEKLTLVSKTRKGKGKSSSKKGNNDGGSS